MLSTNSSSSIQKRRQLHRRQQSLEVPILATPLPANPRRNLSARHGHRRGLSLDQSLSTLDEATEFRPLLPQDYQHRPSGSPSVRIQLDTTNTGPPTDTPQHYVQETQQQSLAQPGYQAQDFQSHLQQQLNPLTNRPPPPLDHKPIIAAPQATTVPQHTALQELQHHMDWYRSTFGHSPISTMPTTPFFDGNQLIGAEMPGAQMPMQMMQSMPNMVQMPQTPVSQGHARTLPNTPQSYAQAWPSPPPTHAKHARSQSYQLDVAPMPDSMVNGLVAVPYGQPHNNFDPNVGSFMSDQGYASSAYSSSVVDPMSPCPQQNAGHLPTLFEEPTPPLAGQHAQGGFDGSSILLHATAGAQDFNDPEFDFGAPVPMSPRRQLLNNLGPEIPASIVDTGIPAYEVQQYMGELTDGKYPCLWDGCKRRFGRKENVRAHIQTHLGDRQFKCDLCDKTFVRQHDLKRHIAIHSDDRPFVCACLTGFARHDALTRHRQRGMCTGALPGFEKSEEEKPKRGRPKKERPDLETRVDKATKQRKNNKSKAAGEEQEQEQEHQALYASSGSGGSDRSFPVTPPDTSDAFDADAFLNMANGDMQFNSITSSWRDTPPTSPVSGSPTKTVDSFDPTNQNFDFDAPLGQEHGISPSILSSHSSPATYNGAAAAGSPESNHDVFDYASPTASSGATSFHGGSNSGEMNFFNNFDAAISAQPEIGYDAFSPPGESNSSSSTYNYSDHGVNEFYKDVSGGSAMPSTMNYDDILSMPKTADSEKSLAGILDEWLAAH
ncbi:hypothetical protein LTR36_008673 [Oleoguttula mirabilis]|uniref:C2H2-type domain-containing protein n=1 Tax=Oleoguttula mirabilis TaxID=1507867 RepID=A0AAV9JTM8_9PEZI|nr:hypothetical protein LTR36_008673 [Oleoguttula mirabilis]